MHLCLECNRACDCLDGETDIESCGHILTPECAGVDDDEEAG